MDMLYQYLAERKGTIIRGKIYTVGLYEAYCQYCKAKKRIPLPFKDVEEHLNAEIRQTKIWWESLTTFRADQVWKN